MIDKCIAQDVFYTVTDSALSACQFNEYAIALNVTQNRVVELEGENLKLLEKIQNDDHDNMVKRFSKLEVEYLNLQLKYQHLNEKHKISNDKTSLDAPEFDTYFELSKRDETIQAHTNTIRLLRAQIAQLKSNKCEVYGTNKPSSSDSQNFQYQNTINKLHYENECYREENSKVKQHFKELYDSIKVTRSNHNDQITSLTNEIENLKVRVKGKMPCTTCNCDAPKATDSKKYDVDVGRIPFKLRNNSLAHQTYLDHLREGLDTLREVVEEDRTDKPLDRAVVYACKLTKRIQENLEYAIGSTPKFSRHRDGFVASSSTVENKHVAFNLPPKTSEPN
ncbi:MAG TPA: hypothetical protein VNB67_05060, partial [Nitrososphaeraceae archaeon]|nr:hypothetical protein [Nitrososphaeraceae archaeon]